MLTKRAPVILSWHLFRVFWTAIAQLVEQRSPKPQVGGSTPSRRASFSLESRRGGRVVECGGLENRFGASQRGFESLPLRHINRDLNRRAF